MENEKKNKCFRFADVSYIFNGDKLFLIFSRTQKALIMLFSNEALIIINNKLNENA